LIQEKENHIAGYFSYSMLQGPNVTHEVVIVGKLIAVPTNTSDEESKVELTEESTK